MNKKIFLTIIFGMFLISLVSASPGTYKQGESIRLTQTCADCTYVNITSIIAPNGTQLVGNVGMTKEGSVFNYTLDSSLTTVLGIYSINGIGNPLGVGDVWRYSIEVTTTGIQGISILENNVLIILSLLSILLLGLGASFKLPSLGFMGSIVLFLAGIYLTIYGLNNVADFYTQGAGITLVGLGFIFMFLSAYEWLGWGGKDEY